MYTLYIGNKNYSSWSLRGWLATKLSGAPFREVMVALSGDRRPDPANRAFSPTARVPCLHDGATVVWDSLAIAEYLAERHPGMWPADPGGACVGAVARARRCTRDSRALRNEMTMCIRERVDVRPWSPGARPRHRARDRDLERGRAALRRAAGRTCAARSRSPMRSTRRSRSASAPTASRRTARRATTCRRCSAHPFLREWEAAALKETAIIEGDEPRIIYRDKLAAQERRAMDDAVIAGLGERDPRGGGGEGRRCAIRGGGTKDFYGQPLDGRSRST